MERTQSAHHLPAPTFSIAGHLHLAITFHRAFETAVNPRMSQCTTSSQTPATSNTFLSSATACCVLTARVVRIAISLVSRSAGR
ncbi:hypothetical protein M3J09_012619 [Ascochyta lentis]